MDPASLHEGDWQAYTMYSYIPFDAFLCHLAVLLVYSAGAVLINHQMTEL